MTIQEIEQKTGMARANIRFYEREGLLHPSRSHNNYRDYSEADLDTLRKIRLLRQLRLPVGEIARLQTGQATLSETLAAQGERLSGEAQELQAAAQLCEALRDAGESYDTLNAEFWLHRAEEPAPNWKPLETDILPVAPYPWKRFCARMLDLSLLFVLLSFLSSLVFRIPYRSAAETNILKDWFYTLVKFYLWAALEALLLCTVGTTPGKWIFGLQVRRLNGDKLTFGEAVFRLGRLLYYGLAVYVPLLSLWRLYRSYSTCKQGELLPWDTETAYSCNERGWKSWLGFGVGVSGTFVLLVLITLQAALPIHRGALTPENFRENCTVFANQFMDYDGQFLNKNGLWQNEPNTNSYRIHFSGLSNRPYQMTVNEEGIVTGVRLEYDSTPSQPDIIALPPSAVEILRCSFVMANNRSHIFSFFGQNDLWADRDWSENFTFTDGCVRVTHEVESSGYIYLPSQGVFFPDSEEKNQSFHWTFIVELTEP